MNIENTKVYTTDKEVVFMYERICGGMRSSCLGKVEDEYDCDDIVGYCCVDFHNFKLSPFGCNSSVDFDVRCREITSEQIRAMYDKKFAIVETPEEKEALDMIDTTSKQVESLANNSESPNSSEWENGDECMWNGIECTFIGMSISHPSIAIVEYLKGLVSINDRVYVDELSKPESPEQKARRERLEAIRELSDFIISLPTSVKLFPVSLAERIHDAGYTKEK